MLFPPFLVSIQLILEFIAGAVENLDVVEESVGFVVGFCIDNGYEIIEGHADVGEGEEGKVSVAVGENVAHEISEKIYVWQERGRGEACLLQAFSFERYGLVKMVWTGH